MDRRGEIICGNCGGRVVLRWAAEIVSAAWFAIMCFAQGYYLSDNVSLVWVVIIWIGLAAVCYVLYSATVPLSKE